MDVLDNSVCMSIAEGWTAKKIQGKRYIWHNSENKFDAKTLHFSSYSIKKTTPNVWFKLPEWFCHCFFAIPFVATHLCQNPKTLCYAGRLSYNAPQKNSLQEGSRGLLRGLDRFDHRRGHKISTYVHWWIRQVRQSKVIRSSS